MSEFCLNHLIVGGGEPFVIHFSVACCNSSVVCGDMVFPVKIGAPKILKPGNQFEELFIFCKQNITHKIS